MRWVEPISGTCLLDGWIVRVCSCGNEKKKPNIKVALSVGRLGRCGRASTEALWRKLPTRRRRESDCSWLVDARCWLPSRESATTPTARPVGSNNWRVSSGPGLSLRPTGPHATARHTTEHPPPPLPPLPKAHKDKHSYGEPHKCLVLHAPSNLSVASRGCGVWCSGATGRVRLAAEMEVSSPSS